MRLRRRVVLVLGLVVPFLASLPPVHAAEDPGAFIDKAGHTVLQLLNDPKVGQAEFTQRLRTLADQDFDVPRIARFVAGPYWRAASEADQQQFVQAFETYMVSVYAQRFGNYRGSVSFKVTGQREEGNVAMVATEIGRSNGQPPAKVTWQLGKTPNGYKITDVSIEGVSQALTYRQEFESVITQNGGKLSALTQQLRQKTKASG